MTDEQQPQFTVPNTTLASKLANLPTKSGIYQFKNDQGIIIYVGKAKVLRNRVRSYFQVRPMDAKTKALVAKIADVEVIVTDSEAEALLLENNLIKELKPRYNILLRDDKSYPYIRVTNEEFPRVFYTRTVIRDGSKYFGPYTDGRYLFYLMKTLKTIFPLRSCDLPLTNETIAAGKYKVCLDFQIKRCEGPCEAHITREKYGEYIKQTVQILNGRTRELAEGDHGPEDVGDAAGAVHELRRQAHVRRPGRRQQFEHRASPQIAHFHHRRDPQHVRGSERVPKESGVERRRREGEREDRARTRRRNGAQHRLDIHIEVAQAFHVGVDGVGRHHEFLATFTQERALGGGVGDRQPPKRLARQHDARILGAFAAALLASTRGASAEPTTRATELPSAVAIANDVTSPVPCQLKKTIL